VTRGLHQARRCRGTRLVVPSNALLLPCRIGGGTRVLLKPTLRVVFVIPIVETGVFVFFFCYFRGNPVIATLLVIVD
jgi:hypothetical protein